METDEIYQNDQDNPNETPQANGNASDSTHSPKYRVLGESGLVEDEDGDVYSASEVDESPQLRESTKSYDTSAYRGFGVSSVLDDKTNPAYWYYYYDERFCGPSREEYMEKMATKYRQSVKPEPEKKTSPVSPEAAIPEGHVKDDHDRHYRDNPRHPSKSKDVPEEARARAPKPEKKTSPVSPEAATPEGHAKEDHDRCPRDTPRHPSESNINEPFFIVSEEIREKANRDQKEVSRCGIHPTYRNARITVIDSLNFVAIVDRDNQVIVSNEKYSDVDFYYNGLARALDRETRKFGFVDRNGNEVIPCVWRSAGQFSEYLVAVQDDYHKSGYVDVTGRQVISCIWKEAWGFHEGLARVQDDNNKIGMIDQRGKVVIPCVWRGMGDFSEGLASFMDDGGKCGYMDRKGKIVIPSRWKNAWTFCEGRAVVQDFNNRLGFIDKNGELVIPCRWKKVNYFCNGLAKVSKSKTLFLKDKWVYIDKQGRIVKQL